MSYRVLVVDDSPIIRSVVRKSISMSGLDVSEVLEAGNGREALEVMGREWVDIVFADLHMPEMDGQELIEHMGRDNLLVSIPVVVVSSDRSAVRIAELRRRGIRAFVKKPFRPETVRDVVQEVLGTLAAPDARPVAELPARLLAETLAWTLEEAAFVALQPDPAPEPWSGLVVVGSLPFEVALQGRNPTAPLRGHVHLGTSPPFALELAANLLGTEPDTTEAARRAHEAVGELLNMFAGALFERWLGQRVVCDIGIPRLETTSGGACEAWRAEATACASMCGEDGQRVEVCVRIEA